LADLSDRAPILTLRGPGAGRIPWAQLSRLGVGDDWHIPSETVHDGNSAHSNQPSGSESLTPHQVPRPTMPAGRKWAWRFFTDRWLRWPGRSLRLLRRYSGNACLAGAAVFSPL